MTVSIAATDDALRAITLPFLDALRHSAPQIRVDVSFRYVHTAAVDRPATMISLETKLSVVPGR
jgi:hypothetical protein